MLNNQVKSYKQWKFEANLNVFEKLKDLSGSFTIFAIKYGILVK